MSEKAPEEIERLKHAPCGRRHSRWIFWHWSARDFADQEIPAADLEKAVCGSELGSVVINERPVAVFAGLGRHAWKMLDSLVEFSQMWAKSAPVLVIPNKQDGFPATNVSPNAYGLHDTGAATANLALQAAALGLHAHSMAGFNKDKTASLFKAFPPVYDNRRGDGGGMPGRSAETCLTTIVNGSFWCTRTRGNVWREFVFSEWEESGDVLPAQGGPHC